MELICTSQLDLKQKGDLLALEQDCQSHDSTTLTFSMEDEELFLLLYDKGRLLSAMSAYFSGDNLWECTAFTHPSCRRQGHFTTLLHTFLHKHKDAQLVFAVSISCPDTYAVIQALGAQLWYEESMMTCSLAAAQTSGNDLPLSRTPKHSPIIISASPSEPNLYEFIQNQIVIGWFHLILNGSKAYFYGFEIQKDLRARGLGTACFQTLLQYLSQESTSVTSSLGNVSVTELSLQVSSDNKPAVTIYKKAGFQVCETLSYYLY